MPRRKLEINPHPTLPFRSSNLAIPPSPFSPRTPITPTMAIAGPHTSSSANRTNKRSSKLPQPPLSPLHWVWTCHICYRQYRLGVTRRCLDDGHYFCSGNTTTKTRNGGRKIKRHRACGSEFDYSGWKAWDTWRRGIHTYHALDLAPQDEQAPESDVTTVDEHNLTPSVVSPLFGSFAHQQQQYSQRGGMIVTATIAPRACGPSPRPQPLRKDCWNRCDYPSECRWGKSYGVSTPLPTATFGPGTVSAATGVSVSSSTLSNTTTPGPPTDFKDILTLEQQSVADTIDGVGADATSISVASTFPGTTAFMDLASLVKSAERRKSRTEIAGPSPLALDPVEASSVSSSVSVSSARALSPFSSRDLQPVSAALARLDEGGVGVDAGSSVTAAKGQLEDLRQSKSEEQEESRPSLAKALELFSGMVEAVRGVSSSEDVKGKETEKRRLGSLWGLGSKGKKSEERNEYSA